MDAGTRALSSTQEPAWSRASYEAELTAHVASTHGDEDRGALHGLRSVAFRASHVWLAVRFSHLVVRNSARAATLFGLFLSATGFTGSSDPFKTALPGTHLPWHGGCCKLCHISRNSLRLKYRPRNTVPCHKEPRFPTAVVSCGTTRQ